MQLVNTIYIPKNKENPSSKLVLVEKDEKGNKRFKAIDKLKIDFYHNKPEYQDTGMVNFIQSEKVDKITCEYDNLYRAMVEVEPSLRQFYLETLNSGENIGGKLKRLHLDYRFHGSDKNIVDFYISKYYRKYNPDNHLYGITKAFVDIEVDGSEIVGFPDPEVA